MQTTEEWREVVLCTCTRCAHCGTLCYDEELIAGWSGDESNLNTKCAHCEYPMVPMLTSTLRRYRTSTTTETETEPPLCASSSGELVMPSSARASWYIAENRARIDAYVSSPLKHEHDVVHSLRYHCAAGIVSSVESLNSLPSTPSRTTATTTTTAAAVDNADAHSIGW